MIDGLNNSTLTRAQVLRQIVESSEVSTKYNHQAYAVMEYFGYLRRQPDAFYLAWIDVLVNQTTRAAWSPDSSTPLSTGSGSGRRDETLDPPNNTIRRQKYFFLIRRS